MKRFAPLAIVAALVALILSPAQASYTNGHATCVSSSSPALVLADCGGVPLLATNNLNDVPSGQSALSNLSGSYTLCQSGASSSITGSTSESALATCAVPANTLAANSCLEIWTLWSWTNNSDTKTARVRFNTSSTIGGTAYLANNVATTAGALDVRYICNANATNSQVGPGSTAFGTAIGPYTSAATTSSVSTTAASDIIITGQDTTSGSDSVTLLAYSVIVRATSGH